MEELELNPITPATVMLTADGHRRMREELEMLTMTKRSEIAERLRDSKGHGEFSEDNSELDEVKFEQAIVETRIAELKGIFATSHLIDPEHIPTDKVGFGTKATVKDVDRSIEFEICLVSSVEADPDNDFISNESPMGIALWGASQGDVVTIEAPAGKIRYEVIKLSK